MRIHCLQHVPFEGPAGIDDWAARKGYPVTTTLLFEHGKLPDREAFDWLVVMGGPMGVQGRDRLSLDGKRESIDRRSHRRG